MNHSHKSNQRVYLLAGLAGLILLVLSASPSVLAGQALPGNDTPSPLPTDLDGLVITTTATLPLTATLDIQATATSSPVGEPSPTSEATPAPLVTSPPLPSPTPENEIIMGTPDASLLITPTLSVTASLSVTAPLSIDQTPTVTPTLTNLWLPFVNNRLIVTPIPSGSFLSCRGTAFNIPDNNPAGVVDSIWIDDTRIIQDLDLRLAANHNWIGDLDARLTHVETGSTIQLLSRPGSHNCSWDNPRIILDDEMVLPVSDQCPGWVANTDPLAPYMRGGFTPDQPLYTFDGQSIHGEWRLQIADLSPNDIGSLTGWCLSAKIGGPPVYTPPKPPKDLPRIAYVSGVNTAPQNMPLDCESRVAVDWARFYGRSIGEYQFFNELPHSDDPDVGFVGYVWGTWGQIPPNDYGVHAEPVAALLRNYGVSAYAHRPLSFDDLKAEIASGHPVFVWIVGASVDVYGKGLSFPAYYRASTGNHSLVTPYEHVVIVVGYNEDTDMVTIKNEGLTYNRSFEKFLRSWSNMGNMAILSHP